MAPPKKRLPESIPITHARQQLCPLVEDLARAPGGKVAITVGEEVAAYLVTPERLAELESKASGRRPSIAGTARIVGEWEEVEAATKAEARAQEERSVAQLDVSR